MAHVAGLRARPRRRARRSTALASTHPIYAPVRSVAQATENFDLITYEKGAAVVRMIEHYLGADVFRDGVRRYMLRHREGNAVADDLWRALGEASGADVARVAQAWIEQPGFPLVTIGARAAAGSASVRSASSPIRRCRPRSAASAGPCRWSCGPAPTGRRAGARRQGVAEVALRPPGRRGATATPARAASIACGTTPATLAALRRARSTR